VLLLALTTFAASHWNFASDCSRRAPRCHDRTRDCPQR
jgi:hypothetical protein